MRHFVHNIDIALVSKIQTILKLEQNTVIFLDTVGVLVNENILYVRKTIYILLLCYVSRK